MVRRFRQKYFRFISWIFPHFIECKFDYIKVTSDNITIVSSFFKLVRFYYKTCSVFIKLVSFFMKLISFIKLSFSLPTILKTDFEILENLVWDLQVAVETYYWNYSLLKLFKEKPKRNCGMFRLLFILFMMVPWSSGHFRLNSKRLEKECTIVDIVAVT